MRPVVVTAEARVAQPCCGGPRHSVACATCPGVEAPGARVAELLARRPELADLRGTVTASDGVGWWTA